MKKSHGFTIVELMVVVAILGILAAITIVGYGSWHKRTLENAVKSDLENAATAMESARNFNDSYPSSVPSTFKSSKNVAVSGGSSDGKFYCVDGVSTQDASVTLYITSASSDPKPGTCSVYAHMVAWWPLNGSAKDASGHGRDGIVYGPTSTNGQNSTSGAYSFSGSSTSYIDTGYTFPLERFTVSLWVNADGTGPSSFSTLISNTRDCCSTYNGFQLEYNRTSPYPLRARLWAGGAATSAYVSYNGLTFNAWTHVAATYDGSKLSLYKDGALVGTSSYSGTLGSPAYNVMIGKMGAVGSGYSFGGKIDDVRIYDTALSSSEITTLQQGGAI